LYALPVLFSWSQKLRASASVSKKRKVSLYFFMFSHSFSVLMFQPFAAVLMMAYVAPIAANAIQQKDNAPPVSIAPTIPSTVQRQSSREGAANTLQTFFIFQPPAPRPVSVAAYGLILAGYAARLGCSVNLSPQGKP
jgi:hypothetical protein